MMPVGAGGGAAFPGPRARRAGQRGSDGRARRAGRPRGRWGRRLSASGRAGVGGVAGPGTRPPQSCRVRGAAVCLAPPGERPVPRFPLGAEGWHPGAMFPRSEPTFPLHRMEHTPCANSESHLRNPFAEASPWVHLLYLE